MWWRWATRPEHSDPKAEEAEDRASALEERADAAEESLRRFLRFQRDPWTGPVLKTIHGGRGRDVR